MAKTKTWNYRVMATEEKTGEVTFSVNEVYYNEKREPTGYIDAPAKVVGNSLSELEEQIQMMLTAIELSNSKQTNRGIIYCGKKFPQAYIP